MLLAVNYFRKKLRANKCLPGFWVHLCPFIYYAYKTNWKTLRFAWKHEIAFKNYSFNSCCLLPCLHAFFREFSKFLWKVVYIVRITIGKKHLERPLLDSSIIKRNTHAVLISLMEIKQGLKRGVLNNVVYNILLKEIVSNVFAASCL